MLAVIFCVAVFMLVVWIKYTVTSWHVRGWQGTRQRYWDHLARDMGLGEKGEKDNVGPEPVPDRGVLLLDRQCSPVPDWMVEHGYRRPPQERATGDG